MLERRHLVMAFAHRGKARLDELTNRRIEIPVGERALIFRLDMILAAPDLGAAGVIVAIAGQLVAQAQERAMRRRQPRAGVLGRPAEFPHLGPEDGDNSLPLVSADPETF